MHAMKSINPFLHTALISLLNVGLTFCAAGNVNNPHDPASDAFLYSNLLRCALGDEKCNNPGNSSGSETPNPSPVQIFYIYAINTPVNGGLGSRAVSTASCQSMQSVNFPTLACTNHLAVLSYSGGDDLLGAVANHGVPTGRAITSTIGTLIVADWATFLSGPLTTDLQTAGVVSAVPTPFYWTSSTANGAYNATYNCANNADGTNTSNGAQGAISNTTASHHNFAVNQPCDGTGNQAYLMCMCWN